MRNFWQEAKDRFIEEGGGVLAQILRYHPKVLVSKQTRRQLFTDVTYGVERSGSKGLEFFMYPSRGRSIKLDPRVIKPGAKELQPQDMAAQVAAEYDNRSLTAAFRTAIEEFTNSRSGRQLIFNRDGTTNIR